MRRVPALSIDSIEVVQSIQRSDNSIRLVAFRRTAIRVFVNSGITDGFDFGVGPNRFDGVQASVIAENLDSGSVLSCGAPWSPGQAGAFLSRDVLSDSINFDVPLSACSGNVRFRATVLLPGEAGAPPVSFASQSVSVSFQVRPAQEVLPFLVSDPGSASPTPTMADFFATFQGPARAHPFSAFTVNPPISLVLGPLDSLTVWSSWERLIAKLTTMIFLFPSTPVGGIRAAIAPNDTSYPWGGMALPRIAVTVPSFIVQAGDTVTCVHELAHAFGLQHVNCGSPAGPFDGRLPLTISDPGIDVVGRSLLPSGTTNEAMTYCNPQWPSIEHWDAMFDRVPVS
jgi:hypothetical protein